MATVDRHSDHTQQGLDSRLGADCRRGQDSLAEVIAIRPARAGRGGLIGSLVTLVRTFVRPRVQATSVRSTPRPPSSPAPRCFVTPPAPHDAA